MEGSASMETAMETDPGSSSESVTELLVGRFLWVRISALWALRTRLLLARGFAAWARASHVFLRRDVQSLW